MTGQQTNNVRLLNVKNVYNTIQAFLNEKGDSSNNTRIAYEKDIRNFFSVMLGKDLNELTENHLRFTKEDILNYRTHLKRLTKEDGSPKYKNSSINRFIDSIRSLFIELESNGYSDFIDKYAFSFKNLPDNDSKSAGELTDQEFEEMQQLALTLENGLMKSLLIGLAGRTSIRLSALLNLKWSDIRQVKEDIWIVSVVDKGNKDDDKPIMTSFYNKLLQLKVEGTDRIFNISDTAVNNMIRRLCKMMNIPEERNVTFHSLKGVGVNVVIDNGGNVFDVKNQANHKNITTSDEHYRRMTKDYSRYAGVIIDAELDISTLESLSKEQLLTLIKSADKSVQRAIIKTYNSTNLQL